MSLKFGNSPAVVIELQPGIYLFPVDSAIGKSYMCKIFKELESIDRVASHTFPSAFNAQMVLDSDRRDVVLLDRYDLCDGDFTAEMQKFAEKGVLLIDYKSHNFPLKCRRCELDMTEAELVVL